jgi:hypothetical protein
MHGSHKVLWVFTWVGRILVRFHERYRGTQFTNIVQRHITAHKTLWLPWCYSILVLYVCFVDRCLSFCTFSFCHCVFCSFPIYGFWLPLCYLQTLLESTTKTGRHDIAEILLKVALGTKQKHKKTHTHRILTLY